MTLVLDSLARSSMETLFSDRAHLSVARIVPLPFTGALARFVGASLPPELDASLRWTRDATGPFGRADLAAARTYGTLRVGRRTVPVELELTPWDQGRTELVVRPARRRASNWGARRRHAWYPVAHDTIDALRHDLLATPRRVTDHPTAEQGRLAG
jgi:hypothetical protein